MMDYPLLLSSMLIRAAKFFPGKEIISVYPEDVFRYTYADYFKRTCKLANALASLGIRKGDRVASIALNSHRHLELYFAAPSMGAVLHTVNFRLPSHHLAGIINHAEDRVLFIEEDLLFFVELVKDQIKTVEHFVVMSQTGKMPQTSLSPVYLYDEWIDSFSDTFDFAVDVNENDPAMLCYTSATTGDPKGVVYTHRGIILHGYSVAVTFGVTERDCMLHVVPMFHANAWGAPFGAVGLGCRQVLPGREVLNMEMVCRLIAEEKITFSAGVPTIWQMLYQYLENGGTHDFSSLRAVISGGSALPRHLMEGLNEKYKFPIMQAYGMTETSPLVLAAVPKSYMADWPKDRLYDVKTTAGLLVSGLDMKIVNDKGTEVKADGKEWGEILVRGPWVASEYYKDPERSRPVFADGWLHTGDVATIDEEGYVRLVDRTKDMIKSGGEWIASVDLENAIMAHPKVLEAAVIGIPHPKWQERPLGCVVAKTGEELTEEDLREFLRDRVKAGWWIPERFIFLEQIPKTSVGKFNKRELREMVASGRIKL